MGLQAFKARLSQSTFSFYQNIRLSLLVLMMTLMLLVVAGCLRILHPPKTPNALDLTQAQHLTVLSDFHDVGVEKFVKEGLAFAIALYGQPHIPVRTVHVKPCESAYTALEDPAQGHFTLCLGQQPKEYAFWGQLAHEISHLLNARFFDCYVEGQSTLFADQFLYQEGLDWNGWIDYFQRGQDAFYGHTYFMMKQIFPLLSPKDLKNFLSFSEISNTNQPWLHIDIQRWLSSLPKDVQVSVKNIILQHYVSIQSTLKDIDPRYQCLKPG